MTLKHSKNVTIPDDGPSAAAGEVVPSDWNADHVFAGRTSLGGSVYIGASDIGGMVVSAIAESSNIGASKTAFSFQYDYTPSVNDDGLFFNNGLQTLVTLNGAKDIWSTTGAQYQLYNYSSGTMGYGFTGHYSDVENLGGGTVEKIYVHYSYADNRNGGTVNNLYGFYSDLFNNATLGSYYAFAVGAPLGGSPSNAAFSFWTAELGNSSTNAYSFWHDEQGVFRIRADNTFDSVYQAIPAGYNPKFTKYTPGAANYERWFLRWNTNKPGLVQN